MNSAPPSPSNAPIQDGSGDQPADGEEETKPQVRDESEEILQKLQLRRPTNKVIKGILRFAPPWYTLNMGTGVISVILHQLPWQFNGLGIIADLFFVLNLVLFLIFTSTMLIRWIYWPPVIRWSIAHPTQSFAYATFSIGLSTIVNFVVITLPSAWGPGWATFAWVLWWIDAVVSVFCNFGILFSLFAFQDQAYDSANGAWLLPAIACIVSSGSGALVSTYLPPAHARLTIAISYILVGSGLPLSLLLMGLYMLRLSVHKLPAPVSVFSVFIPISPCGQGAYAILTLGKSIRQVVSATGMWWGGSMYTASQSMMFANAIYACSVPVGLMLWGLGFFWFVVGVAAIGVRAREGIPFDLSYWSVIFPIGVWNLASIQLAQELNSDAFRAIACIQAVVLVIIWLALVPPTAIFAWTGSIVAAPDVGQLQKKL